MEPFRILFAAVFVVNFFIVARYRRRTQAGERFDWKKEGVWIALPLRAAGLAGLAYILAVIVYPPAIAWSLVDVPDAVRWIGAAFGLAVVPPFIVWTQRHLGDNVSPTVITRTNHRLVTTGPYRYIRHPLYMAGVALNLSLAAIAGSWFIVALLAVGVGFILIRLPKEEAELAARFGEEYARYRARTGCFIPQLGGRGIATD